MVVVFDKEEFLADYPQFSTLYTEGKITDGQLDYFWEIATTIVDNTEDGATIPYDPDNNVFIRKVVLYLLMCHLLTMALWPVGQSGPLTNASEGSVSAGFQIPQVLSRVWFNQTPCGRTLALLLARYTVGGKYYPMHYYHPWG